MPLTEWERDARDNDLVSEPSQPAAEHLPPERGHCFYDALRDLMSEARYDGDDDRETEFIARWSSVSESEGEDVP